MSGGPATIGPYTILGELGRGGMGVVYRARRADLDREFALKVLRPDLAGGPERQAEMVERFRREAQAAARLAGTPGVVGVHDIGEEDGRTYLAMDLVQGHGFDVEVASGDVDPAHAARIVQQAAQALQAAHEAGLIHRDVKPANILVEAARTDGPAGPRAWITDLGLAATIALDAEATRLTKSGTLLGTIAYMPPEQARGEHLTPAADVWALGATLYDALTGSPPFGAGSSMEVLSRLFRDEPEPLRRVVPGVPPALEAIVMHCLERDPRARYASAGALAADLAAWLRGGTPSVRPAGALDHVGRGARRHGRAVAAGALVLLVAGLGAWGGWTAWRASDEAAARRTAEEAHRKAEEARQALAAGYQAIESATREPFVVLENRYLQAIVTGEEVRAAREAVDAVLATQPADRAAVWRVYAAVLAGDSDVAALAALERAGDPVPSLLLARVLILRVLGTATLPLPPPGRRVPWIDQSIDTEAWQAKRDEIADALSRAARSPAWPLLPHGAEAQQVRAALQSAAWGETAEAADLLVEARDDPAWGDVARALTGYALAAGGRFQDAAELLEAVARRRRWPLLLQVSGRLWFNASLNPQPGGLARDAALLRSIDTLRAALQWEPRLTRAAMQCGVVEMRLAQLRRTHGLDSEPGLRRAIAALDAAAKTVESPVHLDIARGGLWLELGRMRVARGHDATEEFRTSIAAATRGIAAFPNSATDVQLLLERGLAWEELARIHETQPSGPSTARARAIADFERVTLRLPEDPWPLNELANAHLRQGQWLGRRGKDPSHAYTEAEGALRRARECEPGWHLPVITMGNLANARADWAATTGGAGVPLLDEAIGHYEAAVKLAPAYHHLYVYLANALRKRGTADLRAGQDPVPRYRLALQHLDHALTLKPGLLAGLMGRGALRLQWARVLLRRPAEAAPHADAALADFEAARKQNPSAAPILDSLAGALSTKADLASELGEDPEPYEERTLAMLAGLIARAPEQPNYYFSRAALLMKRAFRYAEAGRPTADVWRRALADNDACLSHNARYAPAVFNRALCLHQLGRLAEAKAGYERVLGIMPDHRGAKSMLADVNRRLGK